MSKMQLFKLLILFNLPIQGQSIIQTQISTSCTLTIAKNDSLRSISVFDGESHELLTLSNDETSYFEDPVCFKFDNGFFLRIQKVFYGTAYSNVEHVFYVTQQCLLDPVRFDEASKQYKLRLAQDETIRKGEYRTFKDDEITFSFGIWSRDDPNCCPSKGYVKGKYKLTKIEESGRSGYQLTVGEQWLSSEF